MKRDLARFFSAQAPLLRGLDGRVIARLAAAAQVRSYDRGDFILRAGEPAREIWILLEGRVCINRCGWKGGRINLEIMVPGDMFGLPALTHWSHPSDIEVVGRSVAAAVPRHTVLDAIKSHPALASRLFSEIMSRLHFVETQLMLGREPVETRIAAALVYLRGKFGASIPLTSAEIGAMAQTTPETAMRRLKELERAGTLRRRRGRVDVVDVAGLKAKLGGRF